MESSDLWLCSRVTLDQHNETTIFHTITSLQSVLHHISIVPTFESFLSRAGKMCLSVDDKPPQSLKFYLKDDFIHAFNLLGALDSNNCGGKRVMPTSSADSISKMSSYCATGLIWLWLMMFVEMWWVRVRGRMSIILTPPSAHDSDDKSSVKSVSAECCH